MLSQCNVEGVSVKVGPQNKSKILLRFNDQRVEILGKAFMVGKVKLKLFSLAQDHKFFILTIITGLAAGFMAIALHQSIDLIKNLIGTAHGFTWYSFLLGGLLVFISGLITTRFMPTTGGSGVPRIKILLAVHHGYIATKEWITKFFTTLLTLSSGAPLGYEAPIIFIAGGVGSSLGRKWGFTERKLKDLVYVGCSAGIAAAFNTPIAAVIFVFEEITGTMSTKSMGPILISSLVASITASTLIGRNSIFTPQAYSFNDPKELFFYLAMGIVAGLAGPLFISSILVVKKISMTFFKHHRLTPIMFAFTIVGLLSLLEPEVPGNGLETINEYLLGNVPVIESLLILLVLKFIASALCNGSGMSGGIMLPVMLFGAIIGGLFGQLATWLLNIDHMQIGAFCLVGMGAFFASVIRTPFTSVILVFEMTRDYRIVLPLMVANLISYFLAEKVSPGSIYERSANFDGYQLPGHEEEDSLAHALVEEVYKRSPSNFDVNPSFAEVIYPDQTLSYALVKLKKHKNKSHLKVVNRVNPKEIYGTIRLEDILDYLSRNHHAE